VTQRKKYGSNAA